MIIDSPPICSARNYRLRSQLRATTANRPPTKQRAAPVAPPDGHAITVNVLGPVEIKGLEPP